jgi:deoxyadenosine/deoxycytidine kinase
MRIEICGGIGSGKTSFATLLGSHGYYHILENFKVNPFWQPFYSNPNKYNFETEITFLLQHYHDIKIAYSKSNRIVCDFSFYQDLAYAKMGLHGNRLKIFENIFLEGMSEVGQPDLLICLRCDAEILLKRIKNRKRHEEDLINIEFLSVLNEYIYLEADKLSQTNRVIYIDSKKYDFVSNLSDQKAVLSQINQTIIKI